MAAGECLEDRTQLAGRLRVRPAGHETDETRIVRSRRDEVPEGAQRRGVRPVQVVQDEQDRLAGRLLEHGPAQGLPHLEGELRRGTGRRVPALEDLLDALGDALEELVDQEPPRPQRRRTVVLRAARHCHPHALGGRVGHDLAHQAALADARLPDELDEPERAARSSVDRVPQGAQLGVATDDGPGRRSPSGCRARATAAPRGAGARGPAAPRGAARRPRAPAAPPPDRARARRRAPRGLGGGRPARPPAGWSGRGRARARPRCARSGGAAP